MDVALTVALAEADAALAQATTALTEPTAALASAEEAVGILRFRVESANRDVQAAVQAYQTFAHLQGNAKLDDVVAALSSRDEKVAGVLGTLVAAVQDNTKATQNVAVATNGVSKQVVLTTNSINGVTAEVRNNTAAVNGVGTQVAALTTEVGKTTAAVNGVGEKVSALTTEVSGLRADLKTQSTAAIAKIVAALEALKAPAAKATAEKLTVVAELPDGPLKDISEKLGAIANKLDAMSKSDGSAGSLAGIHELMKRYVALAEEAKEAAEKGAVFEDCNGCKWIGVNGKLIPFQN